ncbi:hypothetical protein [Reichenbachiella sp. 5M10]|uniref:hypothetical protein n=1 Tax=Reichenbachiella sp. 5M10 TaxID=1889772 RepID=UPI00117A8FCA|nr:hypothetical protein [Reichenbachiella sp. 5M10]
MSISNFESCFVVISDPALSGETVSRINKCGQFRKRVSDEVGSRKGNFLDHFVIQDSSFEIRYVILI